MAATGYLFENREQVAAVAEPARGPSFELLSPVALTHGVWIVFGFPEVSDGRYYNSALVIDPKGELAYCYRKTLLYEKDAAWATPGDTGYRYFDTEQGRFGVGICMDLNDDRFVHWARASKLDVIAFPTNWVEEGIDVWAYWGYRLQGCPAALVAANTYGSEKSITSGSEESIQFAGRSAIMKTNTIYASAGPVGDGIIRAEL
jgi:predicted amidohydrolase